MIRRVYEQVSKSVKDVFVATDDVRIEEAVKAFGGRVVMTSTEHRSGTDRCNEAYAKITEAEGQEYDVVINVQGDEPFITPEQIDSLKDCFADENTDIATLVKRIDKEEELFDPNKVKVVRAVSGKALYFSRHSIPYRRDKVKEQWLDGHAYYKHIGMYAYRSNVLKEVAAMKAGQLELCESLEQLRWLENGLSIMTAETTHESVGIDTPDDLKRIDLSVL